ncbi:MAG: hypothetical protein OXU69_05905 [Gemmatimonadota bacterium]|nr:hypothetical protein [Gemmatimonadota bacterium]MDE2984222.1 hypothetical protein [Gemmatimonadota bacterium]
MRKALFPLVLALLTAAAPPALAMQGIMVGARAGTLGIGPEAAIALNDQVTLRGGAGLLGFDMNLTGRFGLADERTAKLTFPKAFYTLGADFQLTSLRVGAGILFKSKDPTYLVTLDSGASIDIGEGKYTEPQVKTLTTTLTSGDRAPYLLLGFGSQSTSGLSITADIGVARLADAELNMVATGDEQLLKSNEFVLNLALEEKETRDDFGSFVNYWPVISVSVRYGLSGAGRVR